jgi:hypothetical protein
MDQGAWIFKQQDLHGRWKWAASPTASDFLMAVRRIPHTISLYYLRDIFGIDPGSPIQILRERGQMDFGRRDDIEAARRFFHDFKPPMDTQAIEENARWNSFPMLRIAGMRALLATTAPHYGNVLVDAHGMLHSIDHEIAQVDPSAKDVRTIFHVLDPSTKAFRAMAWIAELNREDIAKLFDGLESWRVWPLGSLDATISYYTQRFTTWKGQVFMARQQARTFQ